MATYGIVHPGEMGAALGARLRVNGRVIGCATGRSEATNDRAASAGIDLVDTLDDLMAEADLVISLVHPDAAEQVAADAAAAYRGPTESPASAPIFVDANSIGVARAERIRSSITEAGLRYVGGGVRGGANRLETDGVIYLSGPDAAEAADLLDPPNRCRIVGPQPHQAKSLKLVVGGLAKGANLLFIELAAGAAEAGLLDEFRDEVADFYPHLSAWFDRFVPTFRSHAARRRVEMAELAELFDASGASTSMIRGALNDLERLDASDKEFDTSLHQILDALEDPPT